MKLCGVRDVRFPIQAIFDCRQNVKALVALLTPDGAKVSLRTEHIPDYEHLPARANMFKAFQIGAIAIAYYVTMDIEAQPEGDGLQWISRTIEPGEVTVLPGDEEAYRSFVDRTMKEPTCNSALLDISRRLR